MHPTLPQTLVGTSKAAADGPAVCILPMSVLSADVCPVCLSAFVQGQERWTGEDA